MKPSIALNAHREAVRTIVAGHRARYLRLFGSVVQGCDTDESDLDLLVDPTPETTLFDIGAIRQQLLELPGVPDLEHYPDSEDDEARTVFSDVIVYRREPKIIICLEFKKSMSRTARQILLRELQGYQ